jgi:flagella basal body P-ring formation protein FlgA
MTLLNGISGMIFKAVIVMVLLAVPLLSSAASQKIGSEVLKRQITEYIQSRAADAGQQAVVKRISALPDLLLEPGNVEYEIVSSRQWDGIGKASLSLIVRLDGRAVRNIPVHCEVEGWKEVVVASRVLERGDLLTEADLKLERREISGISVRPFVGISELLGMKVKTPLRRGRIITSRDLEKVMLVKSGQLVTILAENDLLRLTATGKAKGAGGAGDTIIVQNSASNHDLPARVIDASTVQVEF